NWLLDSFFDTGCISIQEGYNDNKEPKLKLAEFYSFANRQNLLENNITEQFNNLKTFPPMLSERYFDGESEVTYIIPYRLTQNNWSLLAFSTSHQKSDIHEAEFMRMVHLFDTMSSAFDRLA